MLLRGGWLSLWRRSLGLGGMRSLLRLSISRMVPMLARSAFACLDNVAAAASIVLDVMVSHNGALASLATSKDSSFNDFVGFNLHPKDFVVWGIIVFCL